MTSILYPLGPAQTAANISLLVKSKATPPYGFLKGRLGAFYSEAKMDTLEAFTNAAVGLLISWVATFFVLGYSASGSVAVMLMFFGLSLSRSWVLRKLFRRLA